MIWQAGRLAVRYAAGRVNPAANGSTLVTQVQGSMPLRPGHERFFALRFDRAALSEGAAAHSQGARATVTEPRLRSRV